MDRLTRGTVAAVDGNELFADCLGIVLERRGYRFRKVPVPLGQGRTGQLGARLLSLRPDVALVDTGLVHGAEGASLVRAASRAGIATIVLDDRVDERRWGRYLSSGAWVVVPKSASLGLLVSVIGRASRGQHVLDRDERDRLIAMTSRHSAELREAGVRLQRLTAQETVVLRHLMSGQTVREIATERHVSEGTVRSQVRAVLTKLEVSSQISAVALAHAAGWPDELPTAPVTDPQPACLARP